VNADGAATWALTARVCVHEDDLGIMFDVLSWLLRHATTRGWAGYLRETASQEVHHIVRGAEGFEVLQAQTGAPRTRVSWV
jgi:hypothetical protein